MLPVVTFPLIVGETPAGKYRRWLLPAASLLVGAGLGALGLGWRWLAVSALVGYLLLLGWAAVMGRKSRFVLDGTVEFGEDGLRLRGQSWPLAELRRVEARFRYVKGENGGANGAGDKGNQLLVYGRQPGPPVSLSLLVTSQSQRQALYDLLMRWRRQGLDVLAYIL